MEIIKPFLDKDETVIASANPNVKMFAKNKLRSYWLYITMWALMNLFFVYLFFLQDISFKYWFVSIPIFGFDVLGVLAVYNSIAKHSNDIADIGYVYTNKALYAYNSGHNKMVNKIAYADVIGFEKAKEGTKGFYIHTKSNYIKVEYIDNEDFWYKEIVKRVNSAKWKKHKFKHEFMLFC